MASTSSTNARSPFFQSAGPTKKSEGESASFQSQDDLSHCAGSVPIEITPATSIVPAKGSSRPAMSRSSALAAAAAADDDEGLRDGDVKIDAVEDRLRAER
jgi:hypothetical protein